MEHIGNAGLAGSVAKHIRVSKEDRTNGVGRLRGQTGRWWRNLHIAIAIAYQAIVCFHSVQAAVL